ncbi:hypothetical protein C0991_009962 [Blastosporella zonata]|nr:hypothetical protein C0991_009962 [Blastosporella zonata]
MLMDLLPFELIDLVLDFITEGCDWRACSLVSVGWRAPAQIRIFRHTYAETSPQCLRLYYTLLHSPHLGEYIRYPAFKIDNKITAQLASAIIPFLKRILRLFVFCGQWTWPGDRPHELSNIIAEPIYSALCKQPLHSLWLEGCSFANADLQEFFAHAPHLEDLYIKGFTSRAFDNRPLITATRTKLKNLTVALTVESYLLGEWLCNPLCSLDLSDLQYLNIEYVPDYNDQIVTLISKLLKVVGRSVTDVILKRIKVDSSRQNRGVPFRFHDNPGIRRLTLELTPHVVWNPMVCPPRWVESSILRLPQPSQIEELVFNLEIDISPPELLLGNLHLGLPQHTGWARMASLLTKESFPALHSVTITSPLPWYRQLMHQAIGRHEMESMGMKWTFFMSDIYHRPILGKRKEEEAK